MKATKWYTLLTLTMALLLGSGITTAPHTQASAAALPAVTPTSVDCNPGWGVVPSPSPGTSSILRGVATISSSDVWAVGSSTDNNDSARTLIEHWDGSSWSVVASPSPGTDSKLGGVTAISSNDVWAVGSSITTTLIEHWNGSIWSIVPSPSPSTLGSGLGGISAISSNDVWAIGTAYGSSYTSFLTLVEHWDGSTWSVVPSPSTGGWGSFLSSVAAISDSNIWAVGEILNGASNYSTLVEHWDGSTWSIVPSPSPVLGGSLSSVVAISSSDVWAVGSGNGSLAENWNGSSWNVVASPGAGGLNGVAATSASDVWAVGSQISNGNNITLAEHWDGGSWSVVASPNVGTTSTLEGVAALSPSDVWAVGQDGAGNGSTLVEHYSVGGESDSASSCDTPTPAATNTPAPTNTPQPTVCANPFVDINNDIFFVAINTLYCHGAVNGTDASHYTPAGTSTRGQFAKVVVLGFGTPFYTPTTPDFSDVHPSYFAYGYIESGYHAGILSGFDQASCTTHGAIYPCYLPNLAITRGQLTKLVVNAAGYPLYTPTSGQDFTDVPSSNVFYSSIETAYHKSVVGGYPDHTYRPNNPIRRDEMAQIVYKGINTP